MNGNPNYWYVSGTCFYLSYLCCRPQRARREFVVHLLFSKDSHRRRCSQCHSGKPEWLCGTCSCENQQCHNETSNNHLEVFLHVYKDLKNQVFVDVYRPMKKCVRPVRKAPTAMTKHPTAMSLGRCSLAPKWLTTARNNKLPTSKKEKPREQKKTFIHLKNHQLQSRTEKGGMNKIKT